MPVVTNQHLGLMYIDGLSDEQINGYLQRYRLANPEYTQAVRAGRYTNAPKYKYFAHRDGSTLVVPVVCCKAWDPEPMEGRSFGTKRPELRDYQQKAKEEWEVLLNGMLLGKAGTGKTVVGCSVIADKGVPAMVVVPTTDIMRQWKSTFQDLFGIKAYCLGGGFTHPHESASVIISTYQSARKNPLIVRTRDLILVDECHRTPCNSIETILASCGASYRYGCTATPWRSDGLHEALEWLIGPIVAKMEGVGDHLLSATIQPQQTPFYYHYTKVKGGRGPSPHVLFQNAVAMEEDRNLQIATLVRQLLEERDSILVLGHRVNQLWSLKQLIAHPATAVVTGQTKQEERRRIMQLMRDGKCEVLLATYQLAGEGLDIPCLSTLVMASPTGNKTKVEQSVGRICRPFTGKPDPIVYDYVDDGPNATRLWSQRKRTYRNLGYEIKGDSK